ncbi:hypothetical protein C8Q76DRAFT_428045 [Earliella scabrosa]|nr:hypothetical protein C8Q76DRAFT_428045 [Earliella scabrosa]
MPSPNEADESTLRSARGRGRTRSRRRQRRPKEADLSTLSNGVVENRTSRIQTNARPSRRPTLPVEIVSDILELTWLSLLSPEERTRFFRTLSSVHPVFRDIAARLPPVFLVGRYADRNLFKRMDNVVKRSVPPGSSEPAAPRPRVHFYFLWDRGPRVVVSHLAGISLAVKDAFSVVLHVPIMPSLEMWETIYGILDSFESLKHIHLDCGPSHIPIVSWPPSADHKPHSPPHHRLITSLRVSAYALISCGWYVGLPDRFPNLRLLHVVNVDFQQSLGRLRLPPSAHTLVCELSALVTRHRLNTLGLGHVGIGAAIRAGVFAEMSSRQKVVVIRTDVDDSRPLDWWDQTWRVCERYGVRLVRERMPAVEQRSPLH